MADFSTCVFMRELHNNDHSREIEEIPLLSLCHKEGHVSRRSRPHACSQASTRRRHDSPSRDLSRYLGDWSVLKKMTKTK